MADDKLKLEIFKNELKTKQTAIEQLRFEYIKATSNDSLMHYAEQAKDLGLEKLKHDMKLKQVKSDLMQSPPAGPPEATRLSSMSRQKFDYNAYMRTL